MKRERSRRVEKAFFLSFVVLSTFAPPDRCRAETAPVPAASKSPSLFQQIHSSAEDRGVTVSADYTGELLANLAGGLKIGQTDEGLFRLGLQIDLQKLVGWPGATFYASVLDPHGEGISREYSGDLNLASNIDAYNSFRLFELWFQQKMLADTLSIRIGQMAADQEFFLSVNSALFLNSGFGTIPTISFNSQVPIYPVGGLGIRVEYKPDSHWFLRAAVFDADPGMESRDNQHGVAFHLNPDAGLIVFTEGGYTINSDPDSEGLAGTYKIGSWYDSGREKTLGISRNTDEFGFYGLADQMLYRKTNEGEGPASLSAFVRISAAPSQSKNLVPFYIDGGLNLVAPFPTRAKDILGIALGYTKLSDHFMPERIALHSGHETVLEASYRVQINTNLFLQPDLQYIVNPGGFRHLDNALVIALRFDLTY